jgi:hypothetical protein
VRPVPLNDPAHFVGHRVDVIESFQLTVYRVQFVRAQFTAIKVFDRRRNDAMLSPAQLHAACLRGR